MLTNTIFAILITIFLLAALITMVAFAILAVKMVLEELNII